MHGFGWLVTDIGQFVIASQLTFDSAAALLTLIEFTPVDKMFVLATTHALQSAMFTLEIAIAAW